MKKIPSSRSKTNNLLMSFRPYRFTASCRGRGNRTLAFLPDRELAILRFHHPVLAQTNRAVPPSAVFPAVNLKHLWVGASRRYFLEWPTSSRGRWSALLLCAFSLELPALNAAVPLPLVLARRHIGLDMDLLPNAEARKSLRFPAVLTRDLCGVSPVGDFEYYSRSCPRASLPDSALEGKDGKNLPGKFYRHILVKKVSTKRRLRYKKFHRPKAKLW